MQNSFGASRPIIKQILEGVQQGEQRLYLDQLELLLYAFESRIATLSKEQLIAQKYSLLSNGERLSRLGEGLTKTYLKLVNHYLKKN